MKNILKKSFVIMLLLNIFSIPILAAENDVYNKLDNSTEYQDEDLYKSKESVENWWYSLNNYEKDIVISVDELESAYKRKHQNFPIPVTRKNIAIITLYVSDGNYDAKKLVEKRLKQHIADHNDKIRIQQIKENLSKEQ